MPKAASTDSDIKVSPRQLPVRQFKAHLSKELRSCQLEHARWAGMNMAEVLVERREHLEKLTTIQIDQFRKRYQVIKKFEPVMLKACEQTIPFEKGWQYARMHD
jgi:hypothetical protein